MGGLFCSYLVDNRISRLRNALANSQINEIKIELKDSSNASNLVNVEIDSYGNTPLIFSIEQKQIDSCRVLLNDFNADPNKPNFFTNYTPLHVCAAFNSYLNSSSLFISTSFSNLFITKQGSLNNNSKKFAAINNGFTYSETTQKSLESMNQSNSFNKSVMIDSTTTRNEDDNIKFRAIEYNNRDSGKRILTLSTDLTEESSKTPIGRNELDDHMLISRQIDSHTLRELINVLVDKGADLNGLARVNRYTRLGKFDIKHATPLMVAIHNQNLVAVEEFIKLDCNCNYQEPYSKMGALHMACGLARSDIVSLLLEKKGLKVDLKSKEGNTCLHWLALSDKDDITAFQMIINYLTRQYEAENNAKNNSLTDPMYFENLDAYLRKFINETNNESQTALMFASMKNKQNLVKTLLDYDASIDTKDKNGQTALNYAKLNSSAQLLNSYKKIKKITIKKSSKYLAFNRPDSDLVAQKSQRNSTSVQNTSNEVNKSEFTKNDKISIISAVDILNMKHNSYSNSFTRNSKFLELNDKKTNSTQSDYSNIITAI